MLMVKEEGLLNIFLNSLHLLFHSTLFPSTESDNRTNVVNCHSTLVQKTVYWSIVSDFNNIIHHEKVAKELINNNDIFRQYLKILTWFTGMDQQTRLDT
jgi:hypothetical protein